MKDTELMNLNYKVISEHKERIPWKKVYFLISFLSFILILIVVLIIIYMKKQNSDEEKNKDNSNNNEETNDK